MFGVSLNEILPMLLNMVLSFGQALVHVVLVFTAGYLGVKFLRLAIARMETLLVRMGEKSEEVPGAAKKRVTTLMGVIRTISVGIIWTVVSSFLYPSLA